MFARVTTFAGPAERLEAGLAAFREDVIPWLRDATGFRGWLVLLDRAGGRSIGVTFWATREAASDLGASGAALRDEVAESIGAVMQTLDIYEVAVAELGALREEA